MSRRVLIAEDEDSIVASLEFLMKNGGFETQVVHDGNAVLASATAFRPDLVLLDVMLPGMSGFDVCRALRADTLLRRVRVVMLTAKGGRNDVAKGHDCGADEYVVKPFSTRDLMARVRSLLAAKGAA